MQRKLVSESANPSNKQSNVLSKKEQLKEQRNQRKERKRQAVEQFWAKVMLHGAKLADYRREESFKIIMESIHARAILVQRGLQAGGTGTIAYHNSLPSKFFCALVATLSIDQNADVKFRYQFLSFTDID